MSIMEMQPDDRDFLRSLIPPAMAIGIAIYAIIKTFKG